MNTQARLAKVTREQAVASALAQAVLTMTDTGHRDPQGC